MDGTQVQQQVTHPSGAMVGGKGASPKLPRRPMRSLLRSIRSLQRSDLRQYERALQGMSYLTPLTSSSSAEVANSFRFVFNHIAEILGVPDRYDGGVVV